MGKAMFPQIAIGPGDPPFGTDLTPARILVRSAVTISGGICAWAKAQNKRGMSMDGFMIGGRLG
jgi:hypothetical protein